MIRHIEWPKITNFNLSLWYMILSLFVPSVKIYFALSAIYVILLFWKNRNWNQTFIYAYLPLSAFYIGQLYVFRKIDPVELNLPNYPNGINLYYKLTPLFIITLSTCLTWSIELLSRLVRVNRLVVILLILVFLSLVSDINIGTKPMLVEISEFIVEFGLVIWIWMLNNNKVMKFLLFLEKYLKSLIIIISCITIFQGIKRSTLGLIVEQLGSLPQNGVGSDETGWLVRPIGLQGHANDAAYYLLLLIFSYLMVYLHNNRTGRFSLNKWFILSTLAIIWYQSRSVLLASLLLVFWFWKYLLKEIVQFTVKLSSGIWKWTTLVLVSMSGLVIGDRFWNTILNTSRFSGWDTRFKMLPIAVNLINHYFWWGVGKGNFVILAFFTDPLKQIRFFPESVHSGWLLILTEFGIIGLLARVFLLMTLLEAWIRKYRNYPMLMWLFILSIISQNIVLLFQPFSEILTMNVVVAMLLLSDESNVKKK